MTQYQILHRQLRKINDISISIRLKTQFNKLVFYDYKKKLGVLKICAKFNLRRLTIVFNVIKQ